jgi:hypothetical protein
MSQDLEDHRRLRSLARFLAVLALWATLLTLAARAVRAGLLFFIFPTFFVGAICRSIFSAFLFFLTFLSRFAFLPYPPPPSTLAHNGYLYTQTPSNLIKTFPALWRDERFSDRHREQSDMLFGRRTASGFDYWYTLLDYKCHR